MAMHESSRRTFLSRSLGLAALPVVGVRGLLDPSTRLDRPIVDDWIDRARAEIPASTGYRYFQTAGIGPSPTPVLDVVAERLHYQNRGPAAGDVYAEIAPVEPDLRAHIAHAFGADPDEVALTHSTSEGINIVSWSMDWKEGDEVIITNQEHPSNIIPWYNLRDRFGVQYRVVDFSTGADVVEEIRRTINGRTRMVSIPHVGRNNGRALTYAESARLAELLRSNGIRYHLDGAQGPGCKPVDFHALGCDAYSTCGHKWLLGPKGTGAFLVRREVLDETLMSWTGAHSHETMDYDGGYTLLPSARRFEFGTRALADFAGLDAAISWMEDIGFGRIHERIDDLVDHAVERVRSLGRYGIASPPEGEARSGVFVLTLPEGFDATALYNDLASKEGIIGSPVREPRDFRLAIHFFNTTDEIDAALDAMERYVGRG